MTVGTAVLSHNPSCSPFRGSVALLQNLSYSVAAFPPEVSPGKALSFASSHLRFCQELLEPGVLLLHLN